jgi:hypothetical protein
MEPACPPEEKWMREYSKLRRRYRIGDLEKSIEHLSDHDATLAQAVWAVHVEPWPDPKTEPIAPETKGERARLAAQGIEWMAHDIKGDVLGYGEKPDPVENQIRQLASQGFTQRRIQRELRCDRNKIRSVLAAVEVRCG